VHFLDYAIIIFYIVALVFIGLMAKKKAEKGIDAFFLGERKISWWMLGVSGMASNVDITGTMINTALVYMLGVSGMLVEIRGGVVLILAIFMIFMGKWNRRSGAMTVGHWMEFRFGKDSQARWARGISAVGALVLSIGMVAYFTIGSGKFVATLLDLHDFMGLPGHIWGALLMIVLSLVYTISSGFLGVVYTEIFQSGFILVGIICVCTIAFISYSLPDSFTLSIPLADGTMGAMAVTKSQWSQIMPPWHMNFPEGSEYYSLNLFAVAIMFYVFKAMVEGMGGPNGYMAQRYFAAKSDRDADLMSLIWTLFLSLRWPFTVALAMMGVYYAQHIGPINDPEQVLPLVIKNMIPLGLKGLMISAFLAAGMSTFEATINAGAAYWVKDIYQAFISPNASEKKLVSHSRWSSLLIVVFGLILTIFIKSINEIWGWMMMSISIGILVPLMVRWYWWRLNGFGFSMGTVLGMAASILAAIFYPEATPAVSFCLVGIVSFAATIIFSLLTPPTSPEILENFFVKTRPFGFWNPVRNKLSPLLVKDIKDENKMDILSTVLAVPWQLFLFITGMVFMMKDWAVFGKSLFALILLTVGLYFLWYRRVISKVEERGQEKEAVPAL
jgi:solute:Na+ symporter, SSS family